MAENKVQHSDLVASENIFEADIKSAKALQVELDKLELGMKSMLKTSEGFLKAGTPSNAGQMKELEAALKRVTELEKALLEVNTKKRENAKKIKDLTDEEIKQREKQKQQDSERLKNIKEQVKFEEAQIGTEKKLLAANQLLRKERAALNLTTEEGKKRAAELNAEIDKNNKIIIENSDKLKQNKMNVGNYTESIKEAFKDTELFKDGLKEMGGAGSFVSDIFEKVKHTFTGTGNAAEGASKKTGMFGKTLKALGITALITALSGIQESFANTGEGALKWEKATAVSGAAVNTTLRTVTSSAKGLLDNLIGVFTFDFEKAGAGFNNMVNAWSGNIKRIEDAAKATTEFLDAQHELLATNRELSVNLANVNAQLGDLQYIAADETRTWVERNKALKASFVLEKEQLTIEKQLSENKLKIINEEIRSKLAVDGRIVSEKELNNIINDKELRMRILPELLQRQTDAIVDVTNATDKLGDLELEQGKKERQNTQERLSTNIDLIRSKRTSITSRFQEMEEEIKNNKIELDSRRATAEEYLRINAELFQKQLDLINKERKTSLQASELLQERDSEAFGEKLKQMNLTEEMIKQISLITKMAQDKELEGKKNIKDIDDNIIKQEEKINEIRRQNSIQNINEELAITKELRDENKQMINDRIDLREGLYDVERTLIEKQYTQQLDLINSLSSLEKKRIKETIFDEKIKDEELAKLNNKLRIDIEANERAKNKELKALRKEEKQEQERQTQETLDSINNINEAIFDGLDKRSEKRQSIIEQEQEDNEKAIDRQSELAEKGLDNQLAFEEQKKAQLRLKEKQEKEKQARIEEAQQLASAFFEFLKERAKENPNTAPARALGDVLIAKGVSKAIAGLYEGSESVSEKDSVFVLDQPKDNLLIPLHKGERVMGYEDSMKLKGMTNDELVRAGEMYKMGLFIPEDVSRKQIAENAVNSMLLKKIDELTSTIKNKKELSVDWDSFGARVERIVENGQIQVIRKIKTGGNRI